MGVTQDRARLIARIEVEARGFQNAKGTSIRDVRWGKVPGLLNAGTVLGLWTRSASGKGLDAIYHGDAGARPRPNSPTLRQARQSQRGS